jgi:hypothetical protein
MYISPKTRKYFYAFLMLSVFFYSNSGFSANSAYDCTGLDYAGEYDSCSDYKDAIDTKGLADVCGMNGAIRIMDSSGKQYACYGNKSTDVCTNVGECASGTCTYQGPSCAY